MNSQITRRVFIKSLAIFSAVALPAKLLAQQAMAEPPVKVKVVMSSISNNHRHEFTIKLDDLVKGGAVVYSIQGQSSHAHGLQITNETIVALMQGQSVTQISTQDSGHQHSVTMKVV